MVGREIKLDLPSESIYFFGDFELLEHALSNILLNAANYSVEGSPVTVSVRRSDDQISLEVSDMGNGIPEEFISSIFDKFYRVPGTKSGGLGLGLSITKNLLEIHGGEIRARNNNDGGATFSIILPYIEPPEQVIS